MRGQCVDEAEIPQDGAEQLPHKGAYLLRESLLRLGHGQVGLVKELPARARMGRPSRRPDGEARQSWFLTSQENTVLLFLNESLKTADAFR